MMQAIADFFVAYWWLILIAGIVVAGGVIGFMRKRGRSRV